MIWAATRQNQQNGCAPSEDSDQPGHLISLIRVFAVRSVGSLGPKHSSCGQRILWSDWADAQAELSLRWAHTRFVGFVMSQLIWQVALKCLFSHCSRLLVLYVFCINWGTTEANSRSRMNTTLSSQVNPSVPAHWTNPFVIRDITLLILLDLYPTHFLQARHICLGLPVFQCSFHGVRHLLIKFD